jgi:putative PIN family toxin of toxin-antitoxin system
MIITIDTNVMYQALMSNSGASFKILQLIRSGYCKLALSQPVFAEYEEVLTRPKSLQHFELTKQDVISYLRYIAYVGEKYDPYFLFRPNLKDEDDNIFIELAIVSQSKYLITNNVRDFKSGDLQFDNFKLLTPTNFIKRWKEFYE